MPRRFRNRFGMPKSGRKNTASFILSCVRWNLAVWCRLCGGLFSFIDVCVCVVLSDHACRLQPTAVNTVASGMSIPHYKNIYHKDPDSYGHFTFEPSCYRIPLFVVYFSVGLVRSLYYTFNGYSSCWSSRFNIARACSATISCIGVVIFRKFKKEMVGYSIFIIDWLSLHNTDNVDKVFYRFFPKKKRMLGIFRERIIDWNIQNKKSVSFYMQEQNHQNCVTLNLIKNKRKKSCQYHVLLFFRLDLREQRWTTTLLYQNSNVWIYHHYIISWKIFEIGIDDPCELRQMSPRSTTIL